MDNQVITPDQRLFVGRRNLLKAVLCLGVAPSIVRASSLMRTISPKTGLLIPGFYVVDTLGNIKSDFRMVLEDSGNNLWLKATETVTLNRIVLVDSQGDIKPVGSFGNRHLCAEDTLHVLRNNSS